MPDYITLAHDSIKSGTWTPKSRADSLRDGLEAIIAERASEAYVDIKIHDEAGNIRQRIRETADAILAMESKEAKGHTEPMTEHSEYINQLHLRDDQLRRDMAAQRELADERMKGLDDRMKAFMDNQLERDKRIEDIAARATKAAESAATVKSNYWAAVGVQLLAVAAILVGAYFATQANTLSAIATTLSAYQAGKAELTPATPIPATPPGSPKADR